MARYGSNDRLNLKVGVSSFSENLTSLAVVGRTGIGSTSFDADYDLDVRGNANFTGIVSAVSFYGSGQNLTDLIEGKIAGLTVQEEGGTVGTAGSVGLINFVGPNVTATASGIAATITISSAVSYVDNAGIATNVIGGIASVTQLSVSGVSTLGIVTSGNIYSTGIITAINFVGDLTGNATSATYSTSAGIASYSTLSGLATYADNAGIATNIKGGDTGDIPYQSSTNTTTFVDGSLASTGQVLIWNGSIPSWGNVSAASGAFGGISVQDEGTPVGTAGSIVTVNFVGDNVNVTATSGANGIATITVSNSFTQLSVSGISTLGSVQISSGIVTATSGVVTYYGDGSNLSGIVSPASNGEFYTGVSSSLQLTPLSYETSIYTFPSTAGKQYVIESINVANVDTSVGVGTTVNIIASIQDATAGEQTYIAYNVPIVNGGLIELLKNPIVAGPSDVIKMWVTNDAYTGVNNAAEVYMNYSEYTSTEYTSEYASTVSIATTDVTTVYTSSTYPSTIEAIHLANRTDTGDYPVSVSITNGVTTTYLAKNLIIPRYATVDILDRPKRIETNGVIKVEVGQTSTIDVIIAGKQITS